MKPFSRIALFGGLALSITTRALAEPDTSSLVYQAAPTAAGVADQPAGSEPLPTFWQGAVPTVPNVTLEPNTAVGGGTNGNMSAVTNVITGTGLYVGTEWHSWTDTQRHAAINNAAAWGFNFISPKIADEGGSTWYTGDTQLDTWVSWCNSAGIKFFPFSYVNPSTGGSNTGGTATTTTNRASAIAVDIATQCGIVLIDMESEWNSSNAATLAQYRTDMTAFASEYRRLAPNLPIVVTGFGDPQYAFGNNWPYPEMKSFADAYSPQWYYGVWSPYLNNASPQGAVNAEGWGYGFCQTSYGSSYPELPSLSIYTTSSVMPGTSIVAGETRGRDWKAPVIWWEYGDMSATVAAACVGYGYFSNPSPPKPSGSYTQAPAQIANPKPLVLSASSVPADTTLTGTVTLAGPAPPANQVVSLSSNNTGAATVPATVTVLHGSTSATFTVTTHDVTNNTLTTIMATLNGVTTTATVTVTPGGFVLAIDPSTLPGGVSATGTITLQQPAQADTSIAISSDNPAVSPTSPVVVPQGQTSATFSLATAVVASALTANITASSGSVTKYGTLTVTPHNLTGLAVFPDILNGGETAHATVTLDGPAADGDIVTLHSDNPDAVIPDSVTVPAGSTTAGFDIPTKAVDQSEVANFTATLLANTATAQVSLTPLVGDVDRNGVFDINDVTEDLKIAAGLDTATPTQSVLGDVTSPDGPPDNIIGIEDAVALLRQLQGF